MVTKGIYRQENEHMLADSANNALDNTFSKEKEKLP